MTKYEDRLIEEMVVTYELGVGYVWVCNADKQTIRLIVEDEE